VWNSCRDQLFHKWNSTEALVFRVEQWNSVLLFLHQLCIACAGAPAAIAARNASARSITP
jgi:hypothetical protein